jgi:hypothetical protein
MTDYNHVTARKRNFVVRVKLPNVGTVLRTITVEDVRIARNGDIRITRNGDTRIARNVAYGYPRTIVARKRNLVIRVKVNNG